MIASVDVGEGKKKPLRFSSSKVAGGVGDMNSLEQAKGITVVWDGFLPPPHHAAAHSRTGSSW